MKGLEKTKRIKSILFTLLFAIVSSLCPLMLLCSNTITANAAPSETSAAKVIISSYSLENEEVQPGEEFDLTITLKNESSATTASNIVLTYTNDMESVYTVYGNSNQEYVARILPLQEKKVTLKLKTADDIKTETVPFQINIVYADSGTSKNSSDITLQLPINLSSQLQIQSVSLPDTIQTKTNTRVRITLKNTGGEDLRNITMDITGDNIEDQQSVILGRLSSGKLSYVDAYVNFLTSGKRTLNITFTYEDVNGNVYTKKADSMDVDVTDSSEQQGTADIQSSNISVQAVNSSKIIAGYDMKELCLIVGIVVMSGVVVVVMRRYKK